MTCNYLRVKHMSSLAQEGSSYVYHSGIIISGMPSMYSNKFVVLGH